MHKPKFAGYERDNKINSKPIICWVAWFVWKNLTPTKQIVNERKWKVITELESTENTGDEARKRANNETQLDSSFINLLPIKQTSLIKITENK